MKRKLSSKKIPALRPGRWLRFDKRDRDLIKDEVRPWITDWFKRKVPAGTISAKFSSTDDRNALWIELRPPYELPRVQRYLEYLGIPATLREEMIAFYREQNQSNLPAVADWLQDTRGMGRWFTYLASLSNPNIFRLPAKLSAEYFKTAPPPPITPLNRILSSDEKNRKRWETRLKKYGANWFDVHLTSDAVASLTVDLLDEMEFNEITERDNIKKKHQRWLESQMK